MSDRSLKPSWPIVKFGDVVKLNTDRCADPLSESIERYVGLEHIEPEDLRIRRWGLVAEGTTFTNRFKPGQVLFGKRRAYQRKVAVADFEGVCSGDIYVFEPKNERLLPELLPFLCQTDGFFEHAVGTSAGSLSPRTNWTQLADYEFALPPMEEQRRIVELIRASQATVESLQNTVSHVEICERALLNDLMQQLQDPANLVSLSKVLDGSPESGTSAPPRDTPTGHWVLTLSALSPRGYKAGELKPVDKTDQMLSSLLKSGDFLISRSNTRERVGYVGIYSGESEGNVSFPDTMMRLNIKQDLVSNEFVELILQSTPLRHKIMAIAAGTSASMKKINRENLLQIEIPLPNVSQQRKAVAARQQLRQSSANLAERLAQAVAIHDHLLSSLFNQGASRDG